MIRPQFGKFPPLLQDKPALRLLSRGSEAGKWECRLLLQPEALTRDILVPVWYTYSPVWSAALETSGAAERTRSFTLCPRSFQASRLLLPSWSVIATLGQKPAEECKGRGSG